MNYQVGIIYDFDADDAEHAVEQFLDALGLNDLQADEIVGHINHLENI